MGEATQEQLNNPLHGVKLLDILEYLVEKVGWEEMGQITGINAFQYRPTVKSSLRFLRKTDWARTKVEELYLDTLPAPAPKSVVELWEAFIGQNPEYKDKELGEWFNFCDNEKEAKVCAQLTKDGIKQASSTSLWWFEKNHADLPEVGNIYVVTDWYKIAKAIVEVVKVEQIPFNKITEEYAAIEGEGDKSLKYWKDTHWAYYTGEMDEFDEKPTEDMLIVCEQFKTIFTVDNILKEE
ncbi:MAG: hypothetical protein ACJAV5_001757 [Vicingaceae bacterium]|jgi:uncharacterized protein YhfF